ncbi:MAG: hypothetical protein U0W40_04370 [Acidimicrobiia bacterium]
MGALTRGKEGCEAGELAGINPIGLAATNDVDSILAAGRSA